jgi:hypothetical protein
MTFSRREQPCAAPGGTFFRLSPFLCNSDFSGFWLWTLVRGSLSGWAVSLSICIFWVRSGSSRRGRGVGERAKAGQSTREGGSRHDAAMAFCEESSWTGMLVVIYRRRDVISNVCRVLRGRGSGGAIVKRRAAWLVAVLYACGECWLISMRVFRRGDFLQTAMAIVNSAEWSSWVMYVEREGTAAKTERLCKCWRGGGERSMLLVTGVVDTQVARLRSHGLLAFAHRQLGVVQSTLPRA